MYILLTIIILGAVVLAVAGVVAYFNSGARSARQELKEVKATNKSELALANERVAIAQTALIEIAGGDPSPVFRAADALSKITNSYTQNREIG